MKRAIFHLSFPVTSLDASLAFYQANFGAAPGRREDDWGDLVLFGHQITLHERPDEVRPRSERGVSHFGVILDWDAWERLRKALIAHAPDLADRVSHRLVGTPGEHCKLLVEDPDGYLIEVKAYRNVSSISAALG